MTEPLNVRIVLAVNVLWGQNHCVLLRTTGCEGAPKIKSFVFLQDFGFCYCHGKVFYLLVRSQTSNILTR